jgi:hypothetical protein
MVNLPKIISARLCSRLPLTFIGMLAFAQGQPAKSTREALGGQQKGITHQAGVHTNAVPAACNPCVWYSGDFDPNNPNSLGVNNASDPAYPFESQIYVPMVVGSDGNPAHGHVRITSVTFNELLNDVLGCGYNCDYTGSTYDLRLKLGNGIAGTSKASGSCPQSPAPVATGTVFGPYTEYSYTCQSSTKPNSYFLEVPVDSLFWINVTPNFSSGNYAFLSDMEEVPSPNQLGWSDDFYNSFWNSAYFGFNYYPTQDVFGPGYADMFSVAVGGTYVK